MQKQQALEWDDVYDADTEDHPSGSERVERRARRGFVRKRKDRDEVGVVSRSSRVSMRVWKSQRESARTKLHRR